MERALLAGLFLSGSLGLIGCSLDPVAPAPPPTPPPDASCGAGCPPENGWFDSDTDWLMEARYGLFVHFIVGMNDITASSSADWNASVDAFDVAAFADQVATTGAKYVILTLGQDSGYYCAPNATYDGFVGPGKTSKRDLPLEVSQALRARGISLMLYLPAAPPSADAAAAHGLGVSEISSDQFDYVLTPTARERWSRVIGEWSDRYGTGVVGFWFDGAYPWVGFDASYAQAFAAAARRGNPRSIVAFDPTPDALVETHAQWDPESYTAGEVNLFPPASSFQYPKSRWTDHKTQFHVLSFLGAYWGSPDVAPLDPMNELRDPIDPIVAKGYINDVNARGGAVTFDMAIFKSGSFAPAQLARMAAIRGSLREARTVPHIDHVVTATSAADGAPPASAIDADLDTAWRPAPGDGLPQSISYALGRTRKVTLLRYLPPRAASASADGDITSYNVSTSLDGATFVVRATGQLPDSGDEKLIPLGGVEAAWVKLEATSAHGGVAAVANLDVEYEAPPDPVGHWKLDETSGAVAMGQWPHANAAEVNGPTWTGGKHGGGLHFDGIDDWVAPSSSSLLEGVSGQVTLALWVAPASDTAASDTFDLLGRGDASTSGVSLRISQGSYEVVATDGGGTASVRARMADTDPGSWVHLAAVYDGARWILYRDGVEEAESASTVGAPSIASGWAIGGGPGARPFRGDLDDVRIYASALTPEEISDLYMDEL